MANNNVVSPTDVTYMSMALAAFGAATAALSAHDYIVAGGMAIIGIIFVYLYHSFGSPSVPEGTTPVVTQNPPATSATQVVITPAPVAPAPTPTVPTVLP